MLEYILNMFYIILNTHAKRTVQRRQGELHRMRHITETHTEHHSRIDRSGRAVRAARLDAEATVSRPGGREGEERMEIKIIINEAGTGRGMRRMGGEGRRSRRHAWLDREHQAHRPEGHRPEGHRPEGRAGERAAEDGRVIAKVIEMPDGRVKIVSRGEPGTGHGPRRHRGEGQCASRHEGRSRWEGGHEQPETDENREARRARRHLAHEIARALEEAGYNKA